MSRRKKVLLALALILLGGGAGLYWFLNSGRLERYITERAQAELERSLGAKLTIQRLKIDLLHGKAMAEGVVLRGKEAAGEAPLFQAGNMELQASLASLNTNKVDLRALTLRDAKFHLITYPDGSTNLPGPAVRGPATDPVKSFLDWRLGRLEVDRGEFAWNELKTPFALNLSDFQARIDYLPVSSSYRGKVDAAKLHFEQGGHEAVDGDSSIEFQIQREKIAIEKVSFRSLPGTDLTGKGEIRNVASQDGTPLRVELDVEGTLAPRHLLIYLKLPIEKTGLLSYNGKLLFEMGRGLELHGDTKARDIFYRDDSTRLGPLAARARMDVMPVRVTLTNLKAEGFGGSLDGGYRWDQQEGWSFDGDLSNLSLATALRQINAREVPWSGLIAGPIRVSGGKLPLEMEADLEIVSTSGPSPMSGIVALSYSEKGNQLRARNSFLALPNSRLNFAGDLNQGIALEFESSRVAELMPVLRMAGWKEEKLPFEFKQGSMSVRGTVQGALSRPGFHGSVRADRLEYKGRLVNKLVSKVDYNEDLLTLEGFDLDSEGVLLKGALKAVLEDGKLNGESLLSGNLTADVSDAQRILKQAGVQEPLQGAGRISGSLRGTVDEPAFDGTLRAASLKVRQLDLAQVAAAFQVTRRELKVPEWEARLGRQTFKGLLNLKAGGNDWKLGTGNAALKVDALPLSSIPQYRAQDLDVNSTVTADLQSEFSWNPEGVAPSKLDGRLLLATISRFGRPVGQLEFTSRTTGNRALLTAVGSIRQLPVKGDAVIQLGTRLNTELRLQLPKLDFPTIAQLFSREILPSPLPYEGGAEASLYFKGPLLDPEGWDGKLTIPQLQLAPNKEYVKESLPNVADVVLKNEGPIVMEFRRGFVGANNVKLVAKDTNLAASFQYRLDTKSLTGAAKGTINLAILSTLQPDLLAKGVATLDTSIQGTSFDPRLNGKLQFQNASFYLRDVITGLDKVNGTILFDRSRATIEDMKAQTGGGELQLTGFVGFGTSLSYRLQAQASQVRIRYPEGISTSANATLALTGTTAQSILTGNISILRTSIGQIDAATLIANGSGGVGENGAVQNNQFLRNLQFDVRVESTQNAEFSTALTKDIKGEVSLRLRGNPQRPILLGRIAATQGTIDFFGTRYEISRGEVQFNNPLRIEPIVNLDLETRVRGITITMNFTGPANKLNMSYRSDPPLQSSEILALLTVGRNPGTSSSLTQTPVGQSQGTFGNDSSVVLGAAVTAGINGRLQRFFGISRVRIDPQITGIDNIPQARLTLEQQVSRDVTLTYITNLNRTQQQIVRVEWDISRTWSVVAVRDENGQFGMDLFFRKRIK